PTYAEINELLRTGQADVGFICGGAFVEGEREGYLELLVVPEINGLTTYQALIIVPADSPYRRFEDLRGRRFAFTDPLSNSGRLYVQYRLAQMGETPESFFQESIYTYSHDNSIRAVAQGIVDGATVDSLVFDALVRSEPDLGARLRVIERSRPFGIPPVVVHPNLDPALKAAVRQALLTMHQDPQGRQALAVLHVDRFVLSDPAAYAEIRQMAAQLRGWK
ncbi:MAG: phosphate/phosphite/phosphonate ABC transporter substrate-binding protein, partial [Chloroflexi bacterium]